MGGLDKAYLRLGGAALIDHVTARLHPQIEKLAISANGNGARFGAQFDVLADETPRGPLSGILQGMAWARAQGADYIASAAVDTPLLPCDLVVRLRLALEDTPQAQLALTRSGGQVHGTFGLWPVALHADLAAFLASGAVARVTDFAARHNPAYADFADDGAFANINTAADLATIAASFGGAL